MSTYIQNNRKRAGLSQAEVAKVLGVSRPTYTKLEKGESKPTEEQKSLLAGIFRVSKETVEKESSLKEIKFKVKPKEVSKENVEKLKQVLLYIIAKVGGHPNIGQTAIYKLLYFIDFDYYEKYQEYLIGAKYIKNIHGPTPVSFAKVTRDLKKGGELVEVKSKYFNYDQIKYLVTVEPDVSLLSAQELKHIDDELVRLATKTAKELSDLSHQDTPWKVAKDRQELNYRHVFYRPDETSVSDN
ncbi:MAG: type II toxin-antitoxin system antitoxin SocA domain-containing protein [Candidatus Paceibacterota bacterium]